MLLDAFPWSGHATACGSGLDGSADPLCTALVTRHMAASILTGIGLTEWIAETPGICLLAPQLTGDLDRLAGLRAGRATGSQLGIVRRQAFTHGLEAVIEKCGGAWCASGELHKRMKDEG